MMNGETTKDKPAETPEDHWKRFMLLSTRS